jgi:hypothetical protein
MITFNRVCIEDFKLHAGDITLELKRGREYLTSKEENGEVTVFTTYWAKVPVKIFAGEIQFTS